MIALAKQCRLHVLALLYALYALEQIIVNTIANYRILPAMANEQNYYWSALDAYL